MPKTIMNANNSKATPRSYPPTTANAKPKPTTANANPKPKATPGQLKALNYRQAVAKQKANTAKIFGPSANSSDAKYYTYDQLKKQGVPKEYW